MIDIVAGHRVEALVGKIQLYGVSAPERSVFHTLRSGVFSHSGRLKEAYSLPQRSIPTIFPCGLRFAQAMVSAPLPQPISSHTPPSGRVICSAVPSMICFESLRSPS